ncbi:unnamed protein product [Mycena citricolor]|uniref:histidine kinase n=1 Tax=Mycena citricolor TaxID=2018698 RepID=A0AAD2HWB3_9AGAR|nr:unnamed protein product [Mycena citricolor]
MDDTVPVKSVDGAIRKLKQVATQERGDSKLDDLLQAIEAFETRLKPAFLRMKSQETRISLLEAKQLEFDAIRAKANRTVTLDAEVAMLRIDQAESRKQVNAANERWSQALELVKEREADNLRVRRDAEATEQKSVDEVRRLKGYLERNYAARNQLAARIKDLEQERNALLEQHNTNPSRMDSMVDMNTDDENASRRAVFSPHRSSTSTIRAAKRATLDFEGVPGPGFQSSWTLPRGTKRKAEDEAKRRDFPLAVKNGRTTAAVHGKWDPEFSLESLRKSKRRPTLSAPFGSASLTLPGSLPVSNTDPISIAPKICYAEERAGGLRWSAFRSYVKRTLAAPAEACSTLVSETELSRVVSLPWKSNLAEADVEGKDEVDEVIVDRNWADCSETESILDTGDAVSSRKDASVGDVEAQRDPESAATAPSMLVRLLSRFKQFYMPRFSDTEEERVYQREMWGQSKRASLWASVFFVASAVSAVVHIESPVVLSDKIFYYGIGPAMSVPIIFFCAYDFPYNRSFFFQVFLAVSIWIWPIYETLYAYLCGAYTQNVTNPESHAFVCGSKNFLSTFYYTSALQAAALFGTNLKRLPASIGALLFLWSRFSANISAVRGVSSIRGSTEAVADVFNFLIFEFILLYMHYQKEQAAVFAATVPAADATGIAVRADEESAIERTASVELEAPTDIVRVPLNTALLAVQNMAGRPIAQDQELEFTALEGSLSMMSKVLNDVLDFNRMESGRLESLSRPYAFHKVLRSLFIPLKLATDARNLELVTDLDMRIDEVARRAAYLHMDVPPAQIAEHLQQQPSGPDAVGVVVGDESRLRQIVTNLASNACKFTPSGGTLTIRTRLVIPAFPNLPSSSSPTGSSTASAVTLQNEAAAAAPPERIVVRIEVSDTGSGIPPQDMVACKLFSAFNQTEQGRQQGGKGTGLGLALVRQIVKLSGGRLGLQSKVGVGSTFWVELPLGVGSQAMAMAPETPSSVADSPPVFTAISAAEAIDAATRLASQTPMISSRSSSALHGLMDQGESTSHSPVPTRTIGDTLTTVTDYSVPSSPSYTGPLALDDESRPADKEAEPAPNPPPPPQRRPTHVKLPSTGLGGLSAGKDPSALTGLPGLSARTPPAGLNVLVVDDDGMTRAMMSRLLERLGCIVVTAENGEVALGRILSADAPAENAETRFAVVFLDNQMPKMSGVKLVSHLRSLGRSDFVVGVTGNALLTDQQEYLEAGADHVLTKPVREASLKEMLALADARRRAGGDRIS